MTSFISFEERLSVHAFSFIDIDLTPSSTGADTGGSAASVRCRAAAPVHQPVPGRCANAALSMCEGCVQPKANDGMGPLGSLMCHVFFFSSSFWLFCSLTTHSLTHIPCRPLSNSHPQDCRLDVLCSMQHCVAASCRLASLSLWASQPPRSHSSVCSSV